ncbi:MAG: alpha-amylase [Clostridium sp.]|nr:alpha-amylase [Clostridium sp.]
MVNGTMFQAFEWYLENNGNYYNDMIDKIEDLKKMGVTSIWLPPVYKGTSNNDVGYGAYDLYDLGEFDQKGSVRTKYGTKKELLKLIKKLKENEIDVYADIVLNHKAGADRAEEFLAVKVDPDDRNKELEEPKNIKGWTGFDFPGRGDKFSDFKWNFSHFTGVDYDDKTGESGIYRIKGKDKGWSLGVSAEKGNFDYLMFADIDLENPDVQKELLNWADWLIKKLSLDGFRMDALKHMESNFMEKFSEFVYKNHGEDFYFTGEYWSSSIDETENYLSDTKYKIDLFDVPLHFNLYEASNQKENYDLRKIFDNTLVKTHPSLAVTFVDNHDSQPHQALESFVEDWFKEIAYGLILLRKDGYPCVFYGDYYGISGGEDYKGIRTSLDKLLNVRKYFAYGDEEDFFEEKNLIAFKRTGTKEKPYKLIAIISNGKENKLKIFVGEDEKGKTYADYLGNNDKKVVIDEEGYGIFKVSEKSISAYVEDNIDGGAIYEED